LGRSQPGPYAAPGAPPGHGAKAALHPDGRHCTRAPRSPELRPLVDCDAVLIAVLAALAAGGGFASASVLQQRAASTRPENEALSFRPLMLVQQLIVSELLFALPISVRWRGLRMGVHEWLGASAVAAGVTVGLASAAPRAGRSGAPVAKWMVALSVAGGITG